MQTGKAAGPDAINDRILKELADPLSLPLSDIFNYSLSTGKPPSVWKLANVTPIPKKDDPSDVSNYRFISLLASSVTTGSLQVYNQDSPQDIRLLTNKWMSIIPSVKL